MTHRLHDDFLDYHILHKAAANPDHSTRLWSAPEHNLLELNAAYERMLLGGLVVTGELEPGRIGYLLTDLGADTLRSLSEKPGLTRAVRQHALIRSFIDALSEALLRREIDWSLSIDRSGASDTIATT